MQSEFNYKEINLKELGRSLANKLNQLEEIKQPLSSLFFTGNLELLLSDQVMVAIVGSRDPNPYSKSLTAQLSHKLTQAGAIIISGGATGIDAIAHENANNQTIMVSPCSLDKIYPAANAKIIKKMAKNSLILSEYKKDYSPFHYSFLMRNRIILAIADLVIIPHADFKSGSYHSANTSLKLKKPLFGIPHRLGESQATNFLASKGKMKFIYCIDEFIESLGLKKKKEKHKDEILIYCQQAPLFEEAYMHFGDEILEYELQGRLIRENGRIYVR